MKPFSLILAGAFCLALGTASAQSCDHDKASAAKAKASLITQELALNAEQGQQVEDLLVSAEGKMTNQRAEGASAAKVEKRYDAAYDRIVTLLTPEQAAKFKELRASGKLNGGGEGKGCCAGHGASSAKGGCCAGKGSASTATEGEHKH